MKLPFKRLSGQFSLQRLILSITMIAVALVPVAIGMDARRRQQRAISLLESHGVLVGYADQWTKPDQYHSVTASPPGQQILGGFPRSLLKPADFICAVEYNAGAAELSPILVLRDITTVAYVNSKLTGEIVELFRRMPRLATLNLSDTDLDDESLSKFAQIGSLEYINIMGTKVTPEAVLEFKRVRPDCTISSDLDTRFLLCLQRLLELRASKTK